MGCWIPSCWVCFGILSQLPYRGKAVGSSTWGRRFSWRPTHLNGGMEYGVMPSWHRFFCAGKLSDALYVLPQAILPRVNETITYIHIWYYKPTIKNPGWELTQSGFFNSCVVCLISPDVRSTFWNFPQFDQRTWHLNRHLNRLLGLNEAATVLTDLGKIG